MKEEKHSIKAIYNGVVPYVKVTAYELSAIDCSADKMSGYYGEEGVLISDDPQPGYNFSNWSVTGTTLTGNNFKYNGDVTAKANYSAIKYNVTLQNDGHGTIAANKTTGNIGDTITLSNTANSHYGFSGYSITGATLTGNAFNIGTSNVTAKAWFSALPSYTLTLQNDGHGTLTANKVTGYAGDTVTLSPSYNNYYRFNNYSVTGGSINGNTFTFGNGNATAKANFKSNNFTATGSYNSTDAFTYKDAGWWTGECDSYCKIGGITGSTPAAWGSVGSTWTPNSSAHNYSITVNAAATSYIQNTVRRNLNVKICSGNGVVLALNGTASQNNTITVATSYTTTGTAELYVTSLWANTTSYTAQLGTTGMTAGCSFTATGIAP